MGVARLLRLAVLGLAAPVWAQSGVDVKRVGPPGRVSSAIWAGDTLYVSGTMATPEVIGDGTSKKLPTYSGDTKAQTISAIRNIEKVLKEQGLGLGDVVQMQVFLKGDTAKGGAMDVDGMNAAYAMFFGTPEQPNRPVRATVQVAGLVWPGGLVEIMVVAVRPSRK
ncbi:Rid family hydrolase [Granulicella sp. dw_53]|uniref:Rid family hydrolase n=1 Tax=Granulicella sp. dw_53 TaxID=2719792 RepID=UPI001BD30C57|nr:Rid family hydrolase [Granulicella sp. dw_53]